jgi:hypothetical protein
MEVMLYDDAYVPTTTLEKAVYANSKTEEINSLRKLMSLLGTSNMLSQYVILFIRKQQSQPKVCYLGVIILGQ